MAIPIWFAPSVHAGGAHGLLARTLDAPESAYVGQLRVGIRQAGRDRETIVLVEAAPDGRIRREIVDRLGMTRMLIVNDGQTEWFYDHAKSRAWHWEPSDRDFKLIDPDEEFELLVSNYIFREGDSERVAGRNCRVLETVSRGSGALARRTWIDREHGVVLRQTTFNSQGEEVSYVLFDRIVFPKEVDPERFVFRPPYGVRVAASRLKPDFLGIEEARTATNLAPRMPEVLPPGYVFESINVLAYRGVTVLHYRYTDGIDVLSLYQGPKRMRVGFPRNGAGDVQLGDTMGRLSFWSGGKTLEWMDSDRFVIVGKVGINAMRRVADSLAVVEGQAAGPMAAIDAMMEGG